MLLNAYEWNEVVYIYLLYIYIDCMYYIYLFANLPSVAAAGHKPLAGGTANTPKDESQMAVPTPLSSPLLRIARVTCPALPSSCRPRKSRNVSLWTPWRMDNANIIDACLKFAIRVFSLERKQSQNL